MSKINAEWHSRNRMPKNATPEQRIAWHIEHARNCACRDIPAGALKLMKERGINPPAPRGKEAE